MLNSNRVSYRGQITDFANISGICDLIPLFFSEALAHQSGRVVAKSWPVPDCFFDSGRLMGDPLNTGGIIYGFPERRELIS